MTSRKRPASVRIGSRAASSGTEIIEVHRDSDRFTVLVWQWRGADWTRLQRLDVSPSEANWLRHTLLVAAAGTGPTAVPEDLENVVIPEAVPS